MQKTKEKTAASIFSIVQLKNQEAMAWMIPPRPPTPSADTITQHTFTDTFYSGQREPFPTDNLSRKVLPTV